MTLGFFGDSYCSDTDSGEEWNTYIEIIRKHFNASVTSLGTPGSSISDCIINQFLPLFKTNSLPDICIFCWTDPNRLYSSTVKNLTLSNCIKFKNSDIKEYQAGYSFFKYIFDEQENNLKTKAILYWFDHEILSKVGSKLLHISSIVDIDKFHTFTYGDSLEKPLRQIVNQRGVNLNASNHMNGKLVNLQVADLIIKKLQKDV